MFIFPVEEDSWLFRSCLYYGILVLLAELFVPLVFHRRVRFEIPQLAAAYPGSSSASLASSGQRRRKLQQQVAALQRALAETDRVCLRRKEALFEEGGYKKTISSSSGFSVSLLRRPRIGYSRAFIGGEGTKTFPRN
uniref:Uncharacterized protein n=1 Tax=Peronospora matthiolae TaxID=2874970 RepID=A0AAV1UQV7_9STRA